MNIQLFRHISQKRRGFTLVEVLIAITVTGLIMGGITTAIIQMINVNNQNTNSITAQRQVQQVGFAMSNDGLQARSIVESISGDAHLLDSNPFTWPVKFMWIDNNGITHNIVYTLAGNVLTRSETFGASTLNRDIATDISSAGFSRVGNGIYRLEVTSSINGKYPVTETRTYEIKLRAVS
jgi:prepilin-type N-terminal cleavage/methylation domain-containing protein